MLKIKCEWVKAFGFFLTLQREWCRCLFPFKGKCCDVSFLFPSGLLSTSTRYFLQQLNGVEVAVIGEFDQLLFYGVWAQ